VAISGSLNHLSAPELAAHAIKGTIYQKWNEKAALFVC
jgi:hypothetical protein